MSSPCHSGNTGSSYVRKTAQPAGHAGWAVVMQRKQLPLLSGGAGSAPHITRALGPFEHRLNGYPARALQRQPGRLGLITRRAEPVLAVRVLEVQEHPDRGVFPDQPARL